MVERLLTWIMSNNDVREVIRAVRQKHAFIVTEYYMYKISNIRIVGSLYYCLELMDKVPLQDVGIDLKVYEQDHRPETNMYIKKDDFVRLVKRHAEWNRLDWKVALYYDRL